MRPLSRRGRWTALSLALLIGLIALQAQLTPKDNPAQAARLTPGLEDKLGAVARITIGSGPDRIALCGNDRWHLCATPAVAANRTKVRTLLLALARVETASVQTQDARRFPALGLDASSPTVTLADRDGAVLLSLSLGHPVQGMADGRYGIEGRSGTAMVLTGTPELPAGLSDWAALDLPRLPLSDMTRITLLPWGVVLERAGDRMQLASGAPTNEAAAEALIEALAGFAPNAARMAPADPAARRLILTPQSGAPVTIQMIETADGLWLHYGTATAGPLLWLRAPDFQAAAIGRAAAGYRLAR